MAVKVDRVPFNAIPKAWAFDREIGAFLRNLMTSQSQLRERTGGDIDAVSQSNITGGTIQGITLFGIRSSGTGAFDMRLQNTENLTATRSITIATGDSDRAVTLGGNLSTSGGAITLNASGATSVTLPTSGTLATLAGAEALTNKTVNGLTISATTGTLTLVNGSTLATSGANSITLTSTGATNVTLPTSGTLATLAGSETLTNKTLGAVTLSGTVSGGGNQVNNVVVGASNPGAGTFTALASTGAFGCNGATAQAAYSMPADATDLATAITLANGIKAALVANGIGV
jgi:hypothetical protein